MTFPEVEAQPNTAVNQTRMKRQLADQAIAQATAAQWADAADTNKKLLEPGRTPRPRTVWQRRSGSWASWARRGSTTRRRSPSTRRTASPSATSTASGSCSSRPARRPFPPRTGSKAPVSIFVEETGKTGFAFLTDLPNPRKLAQVNPGDAVELTPEKNLLIATSNGMRIGVVEPRVAARLLKLIADGNKYAAGVTSLGDKDVRIIIREIYQDPRNYGKVSFPTAAKSTDLRPYTKGTLVREEMELEEDLEDDEEDEEIEDLDRVLPPESTTDEAFEEEPDELDEA